MSGYRWRICTAEDMGLDEPAVLELDEAGVERLAAALEVMYLRHQGQRMGYGRVKDPVQEHDADARAVIEELRREPNESPDKGVAG